MKTKIIEASVEFIHQPFVKPLQLSSGTITQITEARACVTVRVDGKEAVGRGSIYLSDLWAWPEAALSHEQRDGFLRKYSVGIARNLSGLCGGEATHPLELGLRLHDALHGGPTKYLGHTLPILARAMCASPFDAAIHDGVGQALQISAFDFYDEPFAIPSADEYFPDGGACRAISGVLQAPRRALDAWLIVGAKDDMKKDVAPWIEERGYRCFKLKILGKDAAADATRTSEVFRATRELGGSTPRLCADSNEANPDANSVLDYLEKLRALDAAAFTALEYLEQPTGRDITQHAYDWREVTKLKPVLLDEGLTSLELLETAKRQGWSGLALKTCKGHSFALVAAAWAGKNNMLLSMQDLTNPGLAAIHSALFASHIPTINGVELNSPQFTPEANSAWLPQLSSLFDVRDGIHQLPEKNARGLGSYL